MRGAVFSRSVLLILVPCAIALFAISVILDSGEGQSVPADSSGPGTYSASAVGYAGLFDILRRSGRPVARGTGNSLYQAGPGGTVVVAEPDIRYISDLDKTQMFKARRLLLVLPKWRWTGDERRGGWISKAEPASVFNSQQTLSLATGRGEVYRAEWPDRWAVDETGFEPSGDGTVQLIRHPDMRVITGDGKGALVGEITGDYGKILIISDPDVMSNHGIVKGKNAVFMTVLIDGLRMWENDDTDAPIVFDENVHGFKSSQASLARQLFHMPFLAVTILACMSAAILALSGASRFGTPGEEAPALDFGKISLIDNTARLLDYGGYYTVVLERYVKMTMRSVARALHAPDFQSEASLAEWLDRFSRARGLEETCSSALRVINLDMSDRQRISRLYECARKIHIWKGEIINGPSVHRERH